MNAEEIINHLKKNGDKNKIEGMARFGIKKEKNLGNSVTYLRKYSKKIGKNHSLALELWNSGFRDAMMVAACIEDPKNISEKQMDEWVLDFDSWDICDHVCGHLFDKTPFSYKKAYVWSSRKEEFVKRAGFALIAWLAVHDKKADDIKFEDFLNIIIKESTDERNYVKKSVNWALRNIGKKNKNLNKKAIETAEKIKKIDSKSSKWIANDALRELKSDKIKKRIEKK